MARVLKWKQKVVLAFVTALISTVGALSLGTHSASAASGQYDSQFVTGPKGLGLELMVRRPYARLVRASFTPVSLPLVAGAYIAMAGAGGAPPAPPAPDPAGTTACTSSPACHTATASCCTGANGACCDPNCKECWTVRCTTTAYIPERTGGLTCVTCGHATCPACF